MKLISFDYGCFKFIDSRRFLNSSEENLADQLANRKERDDGTIDYSQENFDKFKQLSSFFEHHSNVQDFGMEIGNCLRKREHFLMNGLDLNVIKKHNFLHLEILFLNYPENQLHDRNMHELQRNLG